MSSTFLVGVTPDFLVDAKGRYEKELEQSFAGVAGLSWEVMPDQPGKVATLEAIDRYDAIFALGLKFARESVTGAKRLALIARWGVGYDMIDTAAITENDIALAITPNAVRRPVAEAILTFVFALGTNLLTQDRLVRAGKWRGDLPKLGQNLAGRTLGSLGCGNIAQQMFRMAQSLGFGRFVAHDPFVDREAAAALNVDLLDKDTVFRESDYVTVNTLLNESTRGLVGERELRLMKPTAYLINTARGPIVDQKALTRALHEGWIAGAGLDVFEVEPLPLDDPIREAPNTILSPHGLPWTNEIARDNGLEACANILTVARGEVPASVVNKDVLKRPGFLKKLESYKK
ncbi:MAG: NAD(P)-dependent oxidoreductase [Bryobacteraceae bacterium]|nr:NAD(P)-dependent oxidoreductase [Bryobacteraceae bacterium]